MEKQSRTAATGRGVVATLAVAVLAAVTFSLAPTSVLAPGSGRASAEVLSSSLTVLADGTGHGTSAACQLVDGSVLVDVTATDGVVCTNDSVLFGWSFGLDENGADSAVFEQDLPEGWSWDPISVAACAGNGVDYTGTGTISADERTLSCVLDQPPSANTASLQIPVVARVDAAAPNLSTYTPTLTVTEAGAAPQVSSAAPITVRAAPRFELSKLPAGGQGRLFDDRDFGNGPEPAYYADFIASIAVPMASNPKGVEPLGSPFSFVDDLSQVSPNALLDLVFAPTSGTATWTQPGGPGSPATITVTGADTSTFVPPTYFGTNVVWYGRVRVALPVAEVPDYPVGKDIVNRYRDFLPVGVNGTPNLGGSPELGSEPGANCDFLVDPTSPNIANDNCAQFHLTGFTSPPGVPAAGTKSIYQRKPLGVPCGTGPGAVGARPRCPSLPGETGSEDGYALEGDAIWAEVYLGLPRTGSGATIPLTNLAGCDRWDPARQQIDPTVAIKFGFPSDLPSSDYTIEYTDQVLADDAARQSAGCGTPGNAIEDGPWHSSIAAAGGPAEVSGVRVTYTGASTFGATSGQGAFAFAVPLVVGDVPGAVADFFSTRWDERVTTQNPSGSHMTARSGYRSTEQVLSLDKDTAPSGQAATATGTTIDFTLTPGLAVPGHPSPPATTGLVVTDLLDPCTVAPTLAPQATDWSMTTSTPADLGPDGLACTGDGETGATLTFEHRAASLTPNEAVQPITYSVVVSEFVANEGQITNTAVVDADGNGQLAAQRTDAVSLTVVAPGAAKVAKVADVAVVGVAPDDLAWTITFSNTVLSPASAGRTEFIDVLPYQGDGRDSSFEGDYEVASIELLGTQADVSVVYTSAPPATVDPDPETNSTTWCAASDLGSPGCPSDLASVTAFKVVLDDFVRNERGGVKVTLSPSGNRDGDTYANSVGLGRAEHLPQPIPATAPAPIRVVGSGAGTDPEPVPTTEPDPERRGPGAPPTVPEDGSDVAVEVVAVAADGDPDHRGPLARTGSALGGLVYAIPLLVGCGAVLTFGRRRQSS